MQKGTPKQKIILKHDLEGSFRFSERIVNITHSKSEL